MQTSIVEHSFLISQLHAFKFVLSQEKDKKEVTSRQFHEIYT